MRNKMIGGLLAVLASCSYHQPLSLPTPQIRDSSSAVRTIGEVLNTRGETNFSTGWGIEYNGCEVLGCNADAAGFSCHLKCTMSNTETRTSVRKEYSDIRNLGCEGDSAKIFWKDRNYQGFWGDSPTDIDFKNAANCQTFINAVYHLINNL